MHLCLLYWAEESEFEVSVLVQLKYELYCLLNHMQHMLTCIPWVMCVAENQYIVVLKPLRVKGVILSL